MCQENKILIIFLNMLILSIFSDIIIYIFKRKEKKMIDYIQIYEKYSKFFYSIPSKEVIICILIGIIFSFIAMFILKGILKVLKEPHEFFIPVLFGIIFSLIYIFLFVPADNPENLKNVKRYNINSFKNLGENIKIVKNELGIVENEDQETNKILDKFYKGDKNLNPYEEKIIKKLKN